MDAEYLLDGFQNGFRILAQGERKAFFAMYVVIGLPLLYLLILLSNSENSASGTPD